MKRIVQAARGPLLLLVLAFSAGCGGPVARADLPGVYVASYSFAKETVEITANGRFTQTVKELATGKVSTARGTWTYDSTARYITFSEDFFGISDEEGRFVPNFAHPKQRGLTVMPVGRWGGRLQFSGADMQPPYVKQ